MTIDVNNADQAVSEPKVSDKEYNFRAQEAKYERILAQEKAEKERLAKELEEFKQSRSRQSEEEDDSDPYVDTKRLEKRFSSFEKKLEEKFDKRAEEKAQKIIEKKEAESWLDNNADFYDVMQNHAQKFYEKAPKLAEAILRMPDTFERKKLVYHNIKSLGLDRPEPKQSSVQDKIDANKRSPYYQPTGVGTAPYAPGGDFSPAGQKNAYEHIQKLKAGLRLG